MLRNELKTLSDLLREVVVVPELGGDGEVIVSAVTFGAKLAIISYDEFARPCALLSHAVLDSAGERLMSAEEWEAFAARHQEAVVTLLLAAKRVNLFGEDDAKNG